MKKTYVKRENNKCESYLRDHINVGNTVIVTDGSYMTDYRGNHKYGIDFLTSDRGLHELLTVKAVNKSFRTDYSGMPSGTLGHHNNCKIQGNDGKIYYCSHVNIERFKQ